jgi:hypothetical protein
MMRRGRRNQQIAHRYVRTRKESSARFRELLLRPGRRFASFLRLET